MGLSYAVSPAQESFDNICGSPYLHDLHNLNDRHDRPFRQHGGCSRPLNTRFAAAAVPGYIFNRVP